MVTITGYVSYTTQEGDRWDLIAYRAWGDVQQMPVLLAANREAGIPDLFSAGTVLRIPVLADVDLISPDLLPPWKR